MDHIANMLTSVRNATMSKHDKVKFPHSNIKEAITAILKEKGMISEYKVVNNPSPDKKNIVITLKYYSKDRMSVIRGLKRISKQGRRLYVSADKIPRVLRGLGTAILSTSQGVLSDDRCRDKNVGGELLCYVW